MADIFISYSVKDEKLARLIRVQLIRQGLSVFLASISINPGDKWTPRIFAELRNSKWVFFIATSNSLASKNVQQELGAALITEKAIVPLMLRIKPDELPIWIQQYQGVLLNDNSIFHLQNQIAAIGRYVRNKKTQSAWATTAIFGGLIWLVASSK